MSHLRTFVTAMTAVVCVGYAGLFSSADADGTSDRPLAPPSGEVVVDGVTLTGQLIQRGGQTEVLFTAHNPGDEKVDLSFQYAAYYTAPAAMFSRMGALPMQVAQEECLLVAEAGKTVQKRVVVSNAPEDGGPVEVQPDHSPAMWNLIVARSEIAADAIWGAEPPAPANEAVDLADQQVLLASSSVANPLVG